MDSVKCNSPPAVKVNQLQNTCACVTRVSEFTEFCTCGFRRVYVSVDVTSLSSEGQLVYIFGFKISSDQHLKPVRWTSDSQTHKSINSTN